MAELEPGIVALPWNPLNAGTARPTMDAFASALAQGLVMSCTEGSYALRTSAVWFIVAAFVSPAFAQPRHGETHPDRLDFGQVRVGSRVEGSVSFYFEGDWTDGLPVQVYPPPFATASESKLSRHWFGPRVVLTIYLDIVTAQPGVVEGDLSVRVGDHEAKVTVLADVVEASPDTTKVLVLGAPFDRRSTESAHFDAWRTLVKEANLDPHYLSHQGVWFDGAPAIPLKTFDVAIVGGDDLLRMTPSEVESLLFYARRGGRVFVAAGRIATRSVETANRLLEPAGLRLADEDGEFEEMLQTMEGDRLAKDPVLAGVEKIVIYRGSPIEVLDPSRAKLLFDAPDFPGKGYAAVAKIGEGEIVALGYPQWAQWAETPLGFTSEVTPEPEDIDNARFLKNVLTLENWPKIEPTED